MRPQVDLQWWQDRSEATLEYFHSLDAALADLCATLWKRCGRKTREYNYSAIEFGYSPHCRIEVNQLIAKALRVEDSAGETIYIKEGSASPTPGLSYSEEVVGHKNHSHK